MIDLCALRDEAVIAQNRAERRAEPMYARCTECGAEIEPVMYGINPDLRAGPLSDELWRRCDAD
jgi:uncharacterized protein with PIN domain